MKRTRTMLRGARSFTIVELLVVLGIILVLVTLVVSVSSGLIKRAERTQTENAMAIVDAAIIEWEAQVGRRMTFGTMNQPVGYVYDIMELPPANGRYIAVYVTNLLAQNPVCRQMLAAIPTELLRKDQSWPVSPPISVAIPGSGGQTYPPYGMALDADLRARRTEFVDSWGNRIAMIFPGRMWRPGDAGVPDEDGTIRNSDESTLGVCDNQRPCMISSGPDGLIGTEGGLTLQQRLEAYSDNIYSYELLPID